MLRGLFDERAGLPVPDLDAILPGDGKERSIGIGAERQAGDGGVGGALGGPLLTRRELMSVNRPGRAARAASRGRRSCGGRTRRRGTCRRG